MIARSCEWLVIDLGSSEWVTDHRGRWLRYRRPRDWLRHEIARQLRIARGLERP